MENSKIKQVGLTYAEAIEALGEGYSVRLPEWTGCWFPDENGKVCVFTRTGDILDTPNHAHYTMREDWQIADGSLGFDFAILAIKAGKKVARSGWNGKNMYVFMRPADNLKVDFIPSVKSLPQSVKDDLSTVDKDSIHFTAYLCMKAADGTIVNGWLASQTDMLANDWTVIV